MIAFLLRFYIQKKITLIQLKEYVKTVNKYFIKEYNNHG